MEKNTIVYIGGFELPDKNAAAQRVIGIAKALRDLGYNVVFLNSLKGNPQNQILEKKYYGFTCLEYGRESEIDYLVTAQTCISKLQKIQPKAVIAYNYPGFALERIRRYCKKNDILCFADSTEWYKETSGNLIYRLVKTVDTNYRMKIVQKKLTGVIAISRYLFDYYKKDLKTVMIPPTVDIKDDKWKKEEEKGTNDEIIRFTYAGSPSEQKERLDLIVNAINLISSKKAVQLNVFGIKEEEFKSMYSWKADISDCIVFHGRVSHEKVIEEVKRSNWTIVIRDDNFVVHAGFPTKVVESISCGTPLIINHFSNVADYVNEKNAILIDKPEDIIQAIMSVGKQEMLVDNMTFDYHRFMDELKEVIQ